MFVLSEITYMNYLLCKCGTRIMGLWPLGIDSTWLRTTWLCDSYVIIFVVGGYDRK
jgi:hypothetical protein